ncbi:MAG: hypothetical protein IT260_18225 [Saprospiraceae bacterium]|nr:hypothetical protein [Saprospiraceae bacterium]
MKLEQLVEAMDAQILNGNIVGAFETFAADTCTTKSNPQDLTHTKEQKVQVLRWFFDNIASINRIERPAVQLNGNVTDSQFVFDFTNRQGQPLVYREVIRRTWADGKVVEEQYLIDQTLGTTTNTAAKKPSKKEAVKDVQPAAAQPAAAAAKTGATKPAKTAAPKAAAPKATAPKAAAPKAAKTPAAKSDKPKTGKK